MKQLTKQELLSITGGEITLGVVLGFGSLGVFLMGVLDGILHPKSCRVEPHA